MKSKLQISAAILLFLALSLACSLAQVPGTAVAPAFDPQTGQPIQPGSDWKDPDWVDPDIVLTNVSFTDLPISEVARNLREQFKEYFDVLLPSQSGRENTLNPLTGLPLPETDWTATTVRLQLRNVTASEAFNTMNLLFENDHTPLRWELKVNGHRPMVLLRVLAIPNPNPPAEKELLRRVYFIGNLIGDEKNGGMTMEQVVKDIRDVWDFGDMSQTARVWQMGDASRGKIQYHVESQLLVVVGTASQIDFMEQTLKALEQKVDQRKIEMARHASASEEKKPAPSVR